MGEMPTRAGSRPVLPKVFERAVVEELLAHIDAPRNASTLKVGYFLRRGGGGADALPVSEGFALLKAAAEKEPVGTRRWFMLQSLRGFAAFRTPGVSPDEGFEAYSALFEHAKEAEKGNAVYPLRQAIAEFVGGVAGKLNSAGLDLAKQDLTEKMLAAAWNAYLLALTMPLPGQSRAPEPPWREAIEAAEAKRVFFPVVEKMSADPAAPKNFYLLIAAVSVEVEGHPEKALELLKEAQPLLPRVQGKVDVGEADQLYDTWVSLLETQKKWDDAIAVQQERIGLLGDGQAKLLLLYRQKGDEPQVEKMLSDLNAPDASEGEVLSTATGLFSLVSDAKAPDAKAGEQGAKLLRSYLKIERPREVENELQARLLLGNYLMKLNKHAEAKAVLAVPHNLTVQSQRALNLRVAIERLYKQIS